MAVFVNNPKWFGGAAHSSAPSISSISSSDCRLELPSDGAKLLLEERRRGSSMYGAAPSADFVGLLVGGKFLFPESKNVKNVQCEGGKCCQASFCEGVNQILCSGHHEDQA